MEFIRLADVDVVETANDTDKVLIEQNGEIKRVPKTEVGGGGIPTVIIKDSGYDNAIAGVSTMATAAPEYTYECINMAFEEAYQTLASGQPLSLLGMLTGEGAMNTTPGFIGFVGTMLGVPCIVINFMIPSITLYWTADGLSLEAPSSGR